MRFMAKRLKRLAILERNSRIFKIATNFISRLLEFLVMEIILQYILKFIQ
jgi:hypothetical protein